MVGAPQMHRFLGVAMTNRSRHHTYLAGAAVLLIAAGGLAAAVLDVGAPAAAPAAATPAASTTTELAEPSVRQLTPVSTRVPNQRPPRLNPTSAGSAQRQTTAASPSAATIHVQSEFRDPGELTDVQKARCGLLEPSVCEIQ